MQKDALYLDENGEYTKIGSSTNRRKMETTSWKPKKLMVNSSDLQRKWVEQGEICYWFKISIDLDLLFKSHSEYFPRHPLAPSVDRIDGAGDYSYDNIVICTRAANAARNVFPFDRFHNIVEIIQSKKTQNNLNNFYDSI